jgi:hypothetical protein
MPDIAISEPTNPDWPAARDGVPKNLSKPGRLPPAVNWMLNRPRAKHGAGTKPLWSGFDSAGTLELDRE